jgi:hypothetical protein
MDDVERLAGAGGNRGAAVRARTLPPACCPTNTLDFDDLLLKTVELFETATRPGAAIAALLKMVDGTRHEPA